MGGHEDDPARPRDLGQECHRTRLETGVEARSRLVEDEQWRAGEELEGEACLLESGAVLPGFVSGAGGRVVARRNLGKQEIETQVSAALNNQGRIRYDPFILILRMFGIGYIDVNKLTLLR